MLARRGLLILAALLVLSAAAPPSESPRELSARGRDLMDAGDLAGALPALERARALVTSGKPFDRELADALAGQLYNLGVRFNNGGGPLEAMRAFTEALRLDTAARGIRDAPFRSSLRTAVLQVARYLAASGHPRETVEACRILSERQPPDAAALCALGGALLALDDPESGAVYEKAASADPVLAEAAAGAGAAWLSRSARSWNALRLPSAREETERAVDWLRRAAALEATSAEVQRKLSGALVRLAEVETREGDVIAASDHLSEAEAGLQRAIGLDPESPWARQDLAMLRFGSGRFEEAAAEFTSLERQFGALLASGKGGAADASWRQGLDAARDNGAACLHNMVVDALNRAQFERARALLDRLCEAGGRWSGSCGSLRGAAASREEVFLAEVARLQQELAREPSRAAALLALGDLYAQVGDYDRALEHYRRLSSQDAGTPGLADRMAAVSDPGPLRSESFMVEPPGGRVRVTLFHPQLRQDLDLATRAAWLRVTTALGSDALAGELHVVVYPSRRVFREKAGSRVSGLVKGFYGSGRISLFEAPSHTPVEWVSVLTHEMAHHAVERLTGGTAPRWLSEGISRYVEGDTAILDRARLARRLESLPALNGLNDLMARAWNDPEGFLDARDAALLAVEEMVRRSGPAGLAGGLRSMAPSPDPLRALEKSMGTSLQEVDAAWRGALRKNG